MKRIWLDIATEGSGELVHDRCLEAEARKIGTNVYSMNSISDSETTKQRVKAKRVRARSCFGYLICSKLTLGKSHLG